MPSSSKKDLYIAKSMAELNTMAELPAKLKTTNAKLLVKTADKMLKEAEHSDVMMDEERAYVLFMKYFNVVTFLKKTTDYKKQKAYYDDLLGAKNLMQAIDRAEKLSEALKDRYDRLEAEAVASKLASLDSVEKKNEEKSEAKKDVKIENDGKKEEKPPEPVPEPTVEKPSGTITPTKLFKLINDKDTQLIIMDVRPIPDYQESRMIYDNCINVPAECIKPGTTVTFIEKSLPLDSQSLWKQRGNIDHIVLLDWNSKLENISIGTPLQTLKDALFKYDSTVIIKSEPLILEGGYEQWLLHYPTRCINPDFKKIQASVQDTSQASLMDFDYPDFDTAFLMTPSPVTKQPEKSVDSSQAILNGDIFGSSLPKIDRSTKPKVHKTNINVTQTDMSQSVKSDSLYPDVRAIAGLSNQIKPSGSLTNQIPDSSNDRSKATANGSADSLSKANVTDTGLTKLSSDLSDEIREIDNLKRQKQAELDKIRAEHEQIILEDKARRARLKEEEERLSKLEELRRKEQKDVADLMRMKKNLQDSTRNDALKLNQELEMKEREQKQRQLELERLAADQAEKKKRQEEVERLRRGRKMKEEDEKRKEMERLQEIERMNAKDRQLELERQKEEERKEKEATEKALKEAHERARAEEEARQRELALAAEAARVYEEEKAKEEARRVTEQRLTEERIRLEKERQKQLEKERQEAEEDRRRKQAELDRIEREKREQLRLEKEKQEKERFERERREREEQDGKRAEEAQRAAEQKMKLMNEAKSTPRTIPDPSLLVGWEKRLDPKTNRYFYINHSTSTTQWEPPGVLGQKSSGTYIAKLQDEPREKKRGLSRSNSSPNIAKMMEDEGKQLPSVDRASKPVKRIEPMPRPVPMPAKRRDLNPVYGNVGSALTGLRNLGNTCYMNSTIQCLNNTSPLVTYLVTDLYLYDINRESELGSHGEVADDFAYVVKALWSGQYRFITPRDFKYVVGRHQPMFSGYDQQDSQEFLTFLLDGLHEGLNKVKERPKIKEEENDHLPDSAAAELAWKQHKLCHESIIVELFQGQLKSTLMCLTCRKQSKTFQAFMYLSLPIPSSSRCSLQDCLRQFLQEEKMTGDCRWRCPRCKCDRDSVKKIDIWKLPRILLIALNRFVYEGQWRNKISAYVDFPVRGLDLSQFVLGPSCKPYKLYGISNHFGTLDGGHYTAYCRNPCTQKWYKFDDHEVYETSESNIKTSAAYVLYYTSIELPPPDFRPTFG